MKKDIEIVAKPSTRLFFVGLTIIESIEGMLTVIEARKQKKTSNPLLKCTYQFITMSEMHQKLGTFSW